jgi:proton glutamate symport protein
MLRALRRLSLTHWILIAMVLGVVVGAAFPKGTTWTWGGVPHAISSQDLKVFSSLFLKMIKCILVPLVFGTLVVGIAGHTDDLKAVGKLALRSILYFEVVTTLALVIGLVVVNLTKPGVGLVLPPSSGDVPAPKEVTWESIADHLVPTSFFKAAAENDVLQVVFFAIVFGVALAQVPRAQREPVLRFCESLTEVMFRFTGLVMKFAPIGVGAAMAQNVAVARAPRMAVRVFIGVRMGVAREPAQLAPQAGEAGAAHAVEVGRFHCQCFEPVDLQEGGTEC